MQLYNKLSAKERAALIDEAGKDRITISFYQYYHIKNPQILRDKLFLEWNALDVLGRIYVSYEGINAQLSVPSENFYALKEQLDRISFLKDIRLNVAIEHDNKSFLKLKVKVRNKIVADGLNDNTFDVTNKGVHLNAKEFNEMLANPDTVCVDMRNHYESEIGHFDGAVTPDVDTFRDSLDIIEADLKDNKDDKNLLMYCTGGIRCEKASAYYKHKGFKNVFQLEGGIIEYTRQVNEEGIVNCANEACHLLFIQCDKCSEQMENTCSTDCQEIIQLSFEEQKELRKGKHASNKIFKKGRSQVLKFKS